MLTLRIRTMSGLRGCASSVTGARADVTRFACMPVQKKCG